ncbi:MAG TPA: MmcB family DNA repair protein [Hyphomicrobiaceae bacterium]|nr:MmcB family DNA repair protein [Hyphomicrobiaceae bacterium]
MTSDPAPMTLLPADPQPDRRQSPGASGIYRGVTRLLWAHNMASVAEVSLANGRRADIVAIAGGGEIWIVEIKSSIEDYRADHKWPEYRGFCDRLYFAVAPAFPRDVLPGDAGLIVADRYGGEVVRSAAEHRLSGARRKALMLRLVHTAAMRLHTAVDPEIGR